MKKTPFNSSKKRSVAVTGIGVISPLGRGKDAFFSNLEKGVSGIDRISLFDASTLPTQIAAEVRREDFLKLVEECREFEELQRLASDRKTLFGFCAVRDAMADAFGKSHERHFLPERAALSLGVGLETLQVDALVPAIERHGRLDEEVFFSQWDRPFQNTSDLVIDLIRSYYPVGGGYSVNLSACVASTQAVGLGYECIARGDADLAVCGGTDSMINPLGMLGFILLGATSQSNDLGPKASRPFDRMRDGFVLGEGAGVLILEEGNRARSRGAHIYGEVAGYGSTLDAYKVTDPHPQGEGAYYAMKHALEDRGIPVEEIDYINSHGTGTPRNDRMETAAIRRLFGPHADRMPVSSTKSMIGHLIAAAGAVEIISALLCFERKVIPPTINYENPDAECDLDYVPNQARKGNHLRTILCNSFGFGGQNAAVVLKKNES